ncbi:MAG: protein kinase [Coriobacteriia bacterium]|nr:protein kinase [Coriobacteriia bacterium]
MTTDELSQYLQSIEREDDYRVDCVLKQSDIETTERVFARSADGGEHGPYIRKRIARDSGMGDIYERIYRANKAGKRFAHIPYVLDFYRTEQDTVVVMEHVNGQTLADVVYERDPGVQLSVDLFPAICDAVSELHESFDPPIIHRDLKPSNVMIRNGVPFIIDFGIAREFHDASETDTTAFGTRAYAPPEQFGYEQTTVRSDVYTLGLLLYYLLVEQTPSPKVIRRRFEDDRIPEELRRVIVYATAFDPKERYESAAELKGAFKQAIAACLPVTAATAFSQDEGEPQPSADNGFAHPDLDIDDVQGTLHWRGAIPLHENEPPTPVNVEIHVSTADGSDIARAAVTPPMPQQAHDPFPATSKPPTKGRARNIAILIFLALLVLTSWRDAIDPSQVTNAYPAPYHQCLYFFCVPVLMAVLAYAGLNKERLVTRYPNVPWPTGKRTVIVGLAIFAFLLVVAYIFRIFAGMR